VRSAAAPGTEADHRVGGPNGKLVPVWEESGETEA